MRIITIVLVVGIIALQWPMWFGKGGWYRVWQIDDSLNRQRELNAQLVVRNAALAADVMDLKTGTASIEERARNELGMIKKDEVFFHIIEPHNKVVPIQPRQDKSFRAQHPEKS